MNRRCAAVLLLAPFLLGIAVTAAPKPGDFVIVPGDRIGKTPLGSQGRQTLACMANPYRADASMSQTYSVWVSQAAKGEQPNTLFIHTVSNGALNVKPLSGVTIDVVRVTSPQFRTLNGLAAGSTLAQIRRRFPQAKAVSGDPTIYDDRHQGIAFEFAKPPTSRSHCIAVLVHPPGLSQLANAHQVQDLLQSPPAN